MLRKHRAAAGILKLENKERMITMSVMNLNESNFNSAVMGTDKPVLIDFWASWCGPCRMQSPIVEELADELEGSVVVAKVNVDEEPGLAAQFGVMSIPTLVFMKDGRVVERRVGVTPKAALQAMLQSVGA